MKKHYRKENDCLNCGNTVNGNYCANCGQENLELKESFWHLLTHSVGHYFHFDSKFNQTILPLLTKPGILTLDYMKGKRARHLHPISMYMFISLVFFLVFFKFVSRGNESKGSLAPEALRDSIRAELSRDSVISPAEEETLEQLSEKERSPHTVEQYLAEQKRLPASKRDGWFKQQFMKSYIRGTTDEHWRETIGEQFRHSMPKMMFLMLPLYALILYAFFRKSDKYYIDHLIHSVHLHCFLFLFWTLLILVRLVPGYKYVETYINWATFIFLCFYFFRSFRLVYGRSRKRTIFKMIGISLSYGISLILVFAIGLIVILALN